MTWPRGTTPCRPQSAVGQSFCTFLTRVMRDVSQVRGEGISCFKCLMTLINPDDTDLLCSHFDGSAKFQVFCPTSTFCMKRTVQYQSKTSVVTTVQRDCALQKYTSRTYDYNDQQWYNKEEIITSAYDEGCFIGEHRGAPTGPPEYCFCSFHLCNSSPPQIEMFSKVCGMILALLIIRLL
ncbi:uncharacterized protein LOC105205431 isoform X2 [Solenopsis invicta]|uniref:uncharacterized protein LOC105205431 isoform X2 n=1 Tax=Solenopsis invicta TaxID=13686 RepID=UPI0005961EA5|nr:uncharacterized protein LOC105205431 isoform X2 [Solenopsis invicta]